MIPIIPVLDVMNGVVVRAIGGKREHYRPIVSTLTKSTEPTDVLEALIDVTGSDVAYVADLDAIISGEGPSDSVMKLIESTDTTLWVDFGIRTSADLDRIPIRPSVLPILATETLSSFDVANAAVRRFEVVGSIDLKQNRLLGTLSLSHASSIAAEFYISGVRKTIVLELAAVGLGHLDSLNIVERIMSVTEIVNTVEPEGIVFVGGGIRNRDDLRMYESAGAAGVLVASALHDGTLA